jgi:hypothetical protein
MENAGLQVQCVSALLVRVHQGRFDRLSNERGVAGQNADAAAID